MTATRPPTPPLHAIIVSAIRCLAAGDDTAANRARLRRAGACAALADRLRTCPSDPDVQTAALAAAAALLADGNDAANADLFADAGGADAAAAVVRAHAGRAIKVLKRALAVLVALLEALGRRDGGGGAVARCADAACAAAMAALTPSTPAGRSAELAVRTEGTAAAARLAARAGDMRQTLVAAGAAAAVHMSGVALACPGEPMAWCRRCAGMRCACCEGPRQAPRCRRHRRAAPSRSWHVPLFLWN